jgi:hypothetical protein
MSTQNGKKNKGQFYTVNSKYILDGLDLPPQGVQIIEPFAGKGDLIDWVRNSYTGSIEAYDIEPKNEFIQIRDTLLDPPIYTNKWIITNPPYLARNKCEVKTVFDKYNTNDLYKCFITSLTQQNACIGGIFIIPVGFFLSPRDVDVRCRNDFLSKYKISKVNYFEEDVFPDTSTTVVAFSFEKSDIQLDEQTIEWTLMPSGQKRNFTLSKKNDWIIGGEIYNLPITNPNIHIRRYVEGQTLKPNEKITGLTLTALDSGKEAGRICLEYKDGYLYKAKDTSRSYATFCIQGIELGPEQQKNISLRFNRIIEEKRAETWSLFLPQFRESKEYARKRIPFELAYKIVLHIITTQPL